MRLFRRPLAVLAGLLLAGCPNGSMPCQTDADCLNGTHCAAGVCEPDGAGGGSAGGAAGGAAGGSAGGAAGGTAGGAAGGSAGGAAGGSAGGAAGGSAGGAAGGSAGGAAGGSAGGAAGGSAGGSPGPETACGNSQDDDGDGAIDCADTDCVAQTCRAAAGPCDDAESCTSGSAQCPVDAYRPATTICRAQAAACDVEERCTGTGAACPSDALSPAGTTCRAAAGSCDPPETCEGSTASCPADQMACPSTQYCSGTSCVAKLNAGASCASASQCVSGFCADGVCCDRACSGACSSCGLPGALGTCSNHANGTDPEGGCGLYTCNGSGACHVTCAAGTCSNACASGAWCSGGSCGADLANGAACAASCACVSNACTTYYRDADNDGYGAGLAIDLCSAGALPAGYAANSSDCNDNNAAVSPADPEVPGDAAGLDEDCNGTISCYADGDNDGFRTTATVPSADADCSDSGEALASEPAADCDDSVAAVHPGAAEVPGNGLDENCDGTVTCFRDTDNDGYRTLTVINSADSDCNDSGEALASDPSNDCNDVNASVNPGALEVVGDPADVDEDCNGTLLCYRDGDGDGFRNTNTTITVTSADLDCSDLSEARASQPATDCCDTEVNAFPGQTAYFTAQRVGCGGWDYNCDGPATLQFPVLASTPVCGGTPPICTAFNFGWQGSVPTCNVGGTYLQCSATCGTQGVPLTQACR